MNLRRPQALGIALAVVLLAALGGWGWRAWSPPPTPSAANAPTAASPATVAMPAPPTPTSAPVAPAVPTVAAVPPAPPTSTGEPALAAGELAAALAALAGSPAGSALLQTSDFPRRFVATVDNLGRAHAPPLLWPVSPADGRFSTEVRDGTEVIATVNGQRYAALVALAEALDGPAAARLYRRLYPQLQQAYEDLGFPGRSFHARLFEVIDLLLRTPMQATTPAVILTDVKGPITSTRPWVRYEFADPALQSLSAGQKMLVRVGPIQQARLMNRLRVLRAALVDSAPLTSPSGPR